MNKLLTVVALLLAVAQGATQTPLGLEEALRLVRQNNLQLKKQEQLQKIAELEIAIKRSQRWPSLDIAAASAYTDELSQFDLPLTLTGGRKVQIALGGHDRTDLAIALRQPLFTGFRLNTQVAIAKTALQSEETRLALLNQQTAYQVYQLFYQAQAIRKERKIQEASLRRLLVQLDQTRSLFYAAQAMAYDTLQVFNQTIQLSIQMDQNLRDQRLLDLQMARLLDVPAPRPIAEEELPKPVAPRLRLDSLKQQAKQRRPELTGVRLKQRSAELQRTLARASYFPDIVAEAKHHYAKPGLNQPANKWMDYTTIGVSLQWNLWRWRQDYHRVQEADAEYARLTLEERELVRNTDYEVERSWENLNLAAKQTDMAERLLAQQQERYRILSAQQRRGVATTNDIIVAEADLTQAELQRQRTLVQYYLAECEMLLATGAIAD